jgi:hypothetical protein
MNHRCRQNGKFQMDSERQFDDKIENMPTNLQWVNLLTSGQQSHILQCLNLQYGKEIFSTAIQCLM